MKRCPRLVLASLFSICLLIVITGCSNGSSSNGGTQPTPGGTNPSAPDVSITANPATLTPGQTTTLTWTSSNATSVSISPAIPNLATVPLSGTAPVTPTATTTWTITATGAGGTKTASVTVTVNAASGPPT